TGFNAFNGMARFWTEDSISHDGYCAACSGHGIYYGSREEPSQDIYIRRNISYLHTIQGFQWNGRVTNMQVDQNVWYNNAGSGQTFEQGVSNSFFRSNLIFNN